MVEIAAAFGVALVLLVVAAGVVYQVALFRALSALGILRPGW
jgi:hypothetical protein